MMVLDEEKRIELGREEEEIEEERRKQQRSRREGREYKLWWVGESVYQADRTVSERRVMVLVYKARAANVCF